MHFNSEKIDVCWKIVCVNANDFAILEKSYKFTHLIPE